MNATASNLSYTPPTLAELDELASRSQVVVVISGDASLGTFAVEDITEGPPLPEARAAIENAGRRFVCLVVLQNGEAKSHLVVPLLESVIWTLASAVMEVIAKRLALTLEHAGFPALPQLPVVTEKVQ